MRTAWAVVLSTGLCTIVPAEAGAWAQPAEYGLVISQGGYVLDDHDGRRLVSDAYAEFGVGWDVTIVAMGDWDQGREGEPPAWRAAGGLRYTLDLDDLDGWLVAAEGTLRYQGEAMTDAPAFVGGGLGYGMRFDVGRSFQLFGLNAFGNIGAGYNRRPGAPGERKLDAVAGLDLDPDWQVSAGYYGSAAPGGRYDAGVYEKHEVQAAVRWRIDGEYALSLSLWRTVARERTPPETTLRLALWTFTAPSDDEDWWRFGGAG